MPTTIIFALGTPLDEIRDFGILANAQSTSPLGHIVIRTDEHIKNDLRMNYTHG